MYLKAHLKHEPIVSLGLDLWGSCRVLIAFECRSHHGCRSWLLSQQDLHNCVWGCWHTGCCSCGALAWSCLSAGHHWVCCKRGVAAWQSCPELRSCSLRAWGALLVSQRGWGHSRISACRHTNCQRSGDFKPSLAAFRAVLCTSLWLLLVSWGFLVSELTLRCCQLKPAVSRRLPQLMTALTAGPWPREYGYSSKDQIMLLFIWAMLLLHFSVPLLLLICFPSPLAAALIDYNLLNFPSPLFQSLLGISRREAGNCHHIRHFENTFVVETVICKKSWSHSPDVTFLGFAFIHMHTHALSPLFRRGNLSYFFYSPACAALTSWAYYGLTVDEAYLRRLLGLNLHSGRR